MNQFRKVPDILAEGLFMRMKMIPSIHNKNDQMLRSSCLNGREMSQAISDGLRQVDSPAGIIGKWF